MECPGCRTLNSPTFKFCARCGAPLTPAASAPTPATSTLPTAGSARDLRAKAQATQPPRSAPAAPSPRARISAIARDGGPTRSFALTRKETRVGRAVAEGEVRLADDPFVAPVHALFRFDGDDLFVDDLGSPNGVFLSMKEAELRGGDELRIGRQRLRVDWDEPTMEPETPLFGSPDPGYVATAVQLLEGGGEGDRFPLRRGENLIGRGSGDVSFPHDGYVSGRHAVLIVKDAQMVIQDLGSANGTFVRISGSARISSGDLLLIGEQILRVDLG